MAPIDYSKYPPNWKTEIRPRIMKRANNRCEVDGCDCEHMKYVWSLKLGKSQICEWYPSYTDASRVARAYRRVIEMNGGKVSGLNYSMKRVRVIITIAHLDHDEGNMNIKDDRLMAMCQLHHLRYDAQEKARKMKAKSSVNF